MAHMVPARTSQPVVRGLLACLRHHERLSAMLRPSARSWRGLSTRIRHPVGFWTVDTQSPHSLILCAAAKENAHLGVCLSN